MRKLLLVVAFVALASSAQAEGRPKGCPTLWCGCWARLQVGLGPAFNLAKHWLTLRHVAGGRDTPVVGSWAVMSRGRRGGGHVGKVVGTDPNGNPIVLSGNHNRRVGTGVYPKRRILAYVQP